MPSWPRSRARRPGAHLCPIDAGECPATAAAGEEPCPPPQHRPPEQRAAAAGRCTPRRSRGTLKDGRRRPEPLLKPQGIRRWLTHAANLPPRWIQLSDLASTSRSRQRFSMDKGMLGLRKKNALHRAAHAPSPYARLLQPAPSHNRGEGQNLLTDLLTSKPEGI